MKTLPKIAKSDKITQKQYRKHAEKRRKHAEKSKKMGGKFSFFFLNLRRYIKKIAQGKIVYVSKLFPKQISTS